MAKSGKPGMPLNVARGIEALSSRVRAEFREMPDLCLTPAQACRLWQIDARSCAHILETLVAEGFLSRTPKGAFTAG